MSYACPEALDAVLAGLQYGDSQFPGGSFAFSWGMECLFADGLLIRRDLQDFLLGQFESRWLSFDRPLIEAAAGVADDAKKLAEIDETIDALTIGSLQRESSSRAGRALLGAHVRLGTRGAADYRGIADLRDLPCHHQLVLGAMLVGGGLPRAHVAVVSAYGFLSGLSTAAIRLGLASHLDTQRAMTALRRWSPRRSAGRRRPSTRSIVFRRSRRSP